MGHVFPGPCHLFIFFASFVGIWGDNPWGPGTELQFSPHFIESISLNKGLNIHLVEKSPVRLSQLLPLLPWVMFLLAFQWQLHPWPLLCFLLEKCIMCYCFPKTRTKTIVKTHKGRVNHKIKINCYLWEKKGKRVEETEARIPWTTLFVDLALEPWKCLYNYRAS